MRLSTPQALALKFVTGRSLVPFPNKRTLHSLNGKGLIHWRYGGSGGYSWEITEIGITALDEYEEREREGRG